MSRASLILATTTVVSLGAVATALVLQHGFDMLPCPWCILQRLIFVVIAVVAAVAFWWRSAFGRRTGGVLVLLLALSGIAAAVWQNQVAAGSASCNLTLADRVVSGLGLDSAWPAVFAAYASCADAAVKLLGVPFEFWSLALFIAGAAGAVTVLRRPLV